MKKINRNDEGIHRILLLTNKAIYNINKGCKYKKSK